VAIAKHCNLKATRRRASSSGCNYIMPIMHQSTCWTILRGRSGNRWAFISVYWPHSCAAHTQESDFRAPVKIMTPPIGFGDPDFVHDTNISVGYRWASRDLDFAHLLCIICDMIKRCTKF